MNFTKQLSVIESFKRAAEGEHSSIEIYYDFMLKKSNGLQQDKSIIIEYF
jgi:hypothetical protein